LKIKKTPLKLGYIGVGGHLPPQGADRNRLPSDKPLKFKTSSGIVVTEELATNMKRNEFMNSTHLLLDWK
jgi:hypothetical protein